MTDILDRLKGRVVQEGFAEGSPAFEKRFLQVRVEECQRRHFVPSCRQCSYFDNCELGKQYLVSIMRNPAKKEGSENVALQTKEKGSSSD